MTAVASCPPAEGPVDFLIGYNADVEAFLTDPSTGRPLRWDPTWTPWVDVYTGPGAAPQRLTFSSFVQAQSRGVFTIPKALTQAMTAGTPTDTVFAARAVLGYTDSDEADHAFPEPLYLLPLDPSRVQGAVP